MGNGRIDQGTNGEALVRRRGWFRRASGKFGSRSGENGAELAGGESIEGAEAACQFCGGDAAPAAKGAEKIIGGGFAFQGVALSAAGNEVAVRIVSPAGLRDDVIEAAGARDELGQTVEAEAAVARMNGFAASFGQEEIHLVDIGGAGPTGEASGHGSLGSSGVNFAGQEDFDDVAGAGALEEAQNALVHESAHGLARGSGGEANAAGEPENGKAKTEFAFEASVAQEMIIDDALDEIETQARDELVFDLFPDEQGIEVFDFHGWDPEREVES